MTLAMVFPGQGSQSVGMQAALAEAYAQIRDTYTEASELLGYDLWSVVADGPAEQLDQTVVTQPAMLAAGVATWRVWRAEGGPLPQQLAGHSLGEYTALVCAGALSFSAAVPLVKRRAELMQNAVPSDQAAMAAVLGLTDEQVVDVCAAARVAGVVEAVNFNAPGQVVISGVTEGVNRAVELAKEAGARRAILLSVSVPSHSTLMEEAAIALADELATVDFSTPELTVIGSTDMEAYRNVDQIRDSLRRQLFSPVQWVGTVRKMIESGATQFVEGAPGKVLTGLSRRIERGVAAVCIDTPQSLSDALD